MRFYFFYSEITEKIYAQQKWVFRVKGSACENTRHSHPL